MQNDVLFDHFANMNHHYFTKRDLKTQLHGIHCEPVLGQDPNNSPRKRKISLENSCFEDDPCTLGWYLFRGYVKLGGV